MDVGCSIKNNLCINEFKWNAEWKVVYIGHHQQYDIGEVICKKGQVYYIQFVAKSSILQITSHRRGT